MTYRIDRKLMRDLESRTFHSFGALSKMLRKKKSLSLMALACEMGFKPSASVYIHRIERNVEFQSPLMVARYANFFGLPVNYVLEIDTNDLYRRLKNRIETRAKKVRGLYRLSNE